MSQCYGPLAARYDALTGDVPYEALETWYETAFAHSGRAVHTVLDLCCGTGTLSLLLAEHGYEMICVDASEEMLSVFQQKLCELPEGVVAPMLLCQRAEKLDLYDTVDAAVCSLDGQCFVDEEDDTLCLWRSEVVENELRYGMDIFRRLKGQTYRREQEEHTEYIYTPETLEKHLVDAGFGSIRLFTDGPQHNQGRLFFTAECVKE